MHALDRKPPLLSAECINRRWKQLPAGKIRVLLLVNGNRNGEKPLQLFSNHMAALGEGPGKRKAFCILQIVTALIDQIICQ
jgi:hypothetical protein